MVTLTTTNNNYSKHFGSPSFNPSSLSFTLEVENSVMKVVSSVALMQDILAVKFDISEVKTKNKRAVTETDTLY